jgi:putative Holliday junction resolvase
VLELSPAAIVVGIPVHMDGSEGEMALEAREFGRQLGRATGVPIVEWDETGRKRKRVRPGEEDMLAAAHLLRSYMDALESGREETE